MVNTKTSPNTLAHPTLVSNQVAKDAIRDGTITSDGRGVADPAALNRKVAFGLNANRQGPLPAGETANNADALMAAAKEMAVPLSRAAVEDWAVKILSGAATEEQFATAAKNAKEKCPVSKLFNAEITMDAKLL